VSEQPVPTRKDVRVSQIRARLNRFTLSRQPGILGPTELIGLAGSAVILILVIVSYLYFLLPARSRLETLQAERTRIQSELRKSREVVQQGQTTDATVQKITQSLDAFESDRLAGANPGRMSLYDSLNQLIRKNALRNTSGPTYTPLEPTGSKTATGSKSVNTKWQSIYPGIAISLTVEGQYQNLRRFVRDIEMSNEFLIINSVELERATETGTSTPIAGDPTGATRGSLVSLRLEMATYFQRSAEGNAVTPVAR
jgi:Tfp pilus assembly protein PilO